MLTENGFETSDGHLWAWEELPDGFGHYVCLYCPPVCGRHRPRKEEASDEDDGGED
jgi:hypothetical protein